MMFVSAIALLGVGMVGCRKGTTSSDAATSVVLFTSVDEPYVRPLVQRFQDETGIHVTLLTDAEASKSVGLAERLRAEKDHPTADVWWDNECFLTVRLADEGVLQPYDSPSASDIPAKYRDPEHRWAGSALRVRVLVSSPKLKDPPPARLDDLLRPDLKGHVVLARPTAGTTAGHVAALYIAWGQPRADKFFADLRANGDAAAAQAEIGKLNVTLPDQGPGEQGTLAMPCAVAMVAHGPHPEAAKRLIDFLLSAKVDRALVDAKFAWCSARDPDGKGKFMDVDLHAAASAMPAAIRQSTSTLEGR
jgi:iron(III) transport system substrate-binding protein